MNTAAECPHINTTNITFSVAGRSIYKDQCQRCYDDTKSENGLDVCLKCFTGNCKSEMFNHSNMHLQQKNHPIILNIKEVMIKEEKLPDEQEKKITKLAIGKPGGADFTGEKWEMLLKIECLVCKVEIDFTKNDKLNSLITSLLHASSQSEQGNIKAWEEEILPCEHTLTLEQFPGIVIASKMLAKCNDCELSSNLWLCLTCGNLSCGRKETGGNAHAIQHFQNSGHPLVVKTGTITPEGDASLYCYACNNDVKDPELPKHLSGFGIDIASQQKTEKSMTEMNLDINLNLLLSKTIEEGKVLTPIYGPGHTGLQNIGNSCYINSVAQILFSLEPFQQWYLDNALDHLNTCYNEPIQCFYCQVSKLIWGLHSGVYSNKKTRQLPETEDGKPGEIEEYQDGISPSSFKLFFNKDHPEFSSNRQQDAFDYLSYILEKFERQEKLQKNFNPKQIFEFELENRLECVNCHRAKYQKQTTWYLGLSVPNWQEKKEESTECDFEEVINKFIGEELIELNCAACNSKTNWVKTQRVKNFPKYLIVIFERMVYDWVPIKLEVKFKPLINNVDLSILARDHSKQGEIVIEDKEDDTVEVEPEISQDSLNQLILNGVPELAAKWALINCINPEAALYWYFDNIDKPFLTQPIPKVKGKKSKSKDQVSVVNAEMVTNLQNMGFTQNQAENALRKCNNNFERALDYLFSHPDEVIEEGGAAPAGRKSEDTNEYNQNNSPIFNMYAFLTHLGRNTSHGHYVCHLKKGDEWVYFNDTRVNISTDPPLHKGYIYLYKNQSS